MSNTENKNDNANQEGVPADRQTYLYHKQEMRRHRVPPDFQPSGGARKGPVKDMARQTLFSNIRIALIVMVIMLGLLLIAVVIAKKGWELRRRSVTKNRPATYTGSTQGGEVIEGNEEMAQEMGLEGTDGGLVTDGKSLDTSAIRKAVFLARRGQKQALAGDLTSAVALYAEALEVWPHLSQVWADLGQAYLRQGEYNRAQVALSKSVEQDPANPQLLNDLGVAHLYLGEHEQAAELFRVATEIDENFVDAYFNLGLCSLATGDRASAREEFAEFLLMKPGDARALKELAYLDAAEGKYKQARAQLERAIEDRPDWPILYYDAAAASALIGEMEQTFHYLDRGAELTGPAAAYKVYLQPAFKEMRLTELGEEFEKNLAAQARELLQKVPESENESAALTEQASEPLSTVSGEIVQERSEAE
jgi:tetratricopeptide (TPR) repeat protein